MSGPSVHPMLGNKTPCEDVPQGLKWLVSHKYDGIRALMTTAGPRSRSGKKFPNRALRSLLETLPRGLDGELMHESVFTPFHKTQSAVNAEDGPADGWIYVVYDSFWFGADRTASTRYFDALHAVRKWEAETQMSPNLLRIIMPDYEVMETHQLPKALLDAEASGYEGICGRQLATPYLFGKPSKLSWNLVAWKRFIDFEARVDDMEELMINGNPQEVDNHGRAKRGSSQSNKYGSDRMGKVVCTAINGDFADVEFKVGSGFSDKQRKEMWRNRDAWTGRILTLKYQPFGSKNKPRTPIFRHERLPE